MSAGKCLCCGAPAVPGASKTTKMVRACLERGARIDAWDATITEWARASREKREREESGT